MFFSPIGPSPPPRPSLGPAVVPTVSPVPAPIVEQQPLENGTDPVQPGPSHIPSLSVTSVEVKDRKDHPALSTDPSQGALMHVPAEQQKVAYLSLLCLPCNMHTWYISALQIQYT